MKRPLAATSAALLLLLLGACTSRPEVPAASSTTQQLSDVKPTSIHWTPHVVMTDFCNEHLLMTVTLPGGETLGYRDRMNTAADVRAGSIRCIIEPDPLSSGLHAEVFARADLTIIEFDPELPPSERQWDPNAPGSTYAGELDGIPLSEEELFDDDEHVSGEIVAYAHPKRFAAVTAGLHVSLEVMFIVSGATEARQGGFEDEAVAVFDTYMQTITEQLA